jgi:hypothetical protein
LILNAHPTYPVSRSYVLKLHRDADPARGQFAGRLENVATGTQYEFTTGGELLGCLTRDAFALAAAAPTDLAVPTEEPST